MCPASDPSGNKPHHASHDAEGAAETGGPAAPRHRQGSLLDRYRQVRQRSRYLTRSLAPEDQVVQSMEDVSPTKWHLAHATWFFETFLLQPHLEAYRLHNADYPYLFNSYYVQAGERHCRARRGYLSRPTVAEVWTYREAVDEAMVRLLGRALAPEVRDLVELGLNHEQQHQELMLTDIKHVFSVNPLRPAYFEVEPADVSAAASTGESAEPLRWLEFPEGIHDIGWTGEGFCYDNELPRHRALVQPFALGHRLVTNGEFLEFMADGGYKRPELWMSEGWATREALGWNEPFYWERRHGTWEIFTLRGMERLDPTEPVSHVTWYEADAFARWAGARLPTEEEWEIAAGTVAIEGNFVDSGRFHPAALGAADATLAVEPRQMYGDVWEWTSSPYRPYPGYRPAPGAVGEYNGKFMVNQFVLRGGSCATSKSHIRPTYRNFFHPDKAWQLTGFRLARDL